MFYQLDWQQMEKNWKVICTASFFFIVAHYSRFCSLISASSSLATRGEKKVAAAAHQRSWFVFLKLGGVSPRITAKEQLRLNVLSFISISMQRFEIRPPPPTLQPVPPLSSTMPLKPQADNQPQRMVSTPNRPCSPLSCSLPTESR